MPLHSIAKSALKPIFSPPPHPSFFAPKSPFFPLFPVLDSISGTFSRKRARFPRSTVYFLSHSPILNPISGVFSRARPRFFPFYRLFLFPFSHFESKLRRFCDVTSLFSAPKLTFSLLFPVLPHASGASLRDLTLYYRHISLFAQREGFFISCFPFSPIFLTFIFQQQSFRPSFTPPSSPPPPLSFSFLPTLPSPSPINARTHAPSRNTRVRVCPHTPTLQEVFVYNLHLFTYPSQSTVNQRVRGEEKTRKNLHKMHNTLTINTLTQIPDFIRRKLHLITAVNPTIPTVNIKTKSLHPLRAVPQPFVAYR